MDKPIKIINSDSKRIRLSFLLGSGISIKTGMPSTWDITDQVLSGTKVHHSTDSTYYIGDDSGFPDDYTHRIVPFVNLIKDEIEKFYNQENQTLRANYEQIYYVIKQLDDSESGEYDNPAVDALKQKILPSMQNIIKKSTQPLSQARRFIEITSGSVNYIQDIIWSMLRKKPSNLENLQCLIDSCFEKNLSRVCFFSLNHDIVLEELFSSNGVDFNCGFDSPINDVQYWSPKLLNDSKEKVKLIKLHGSVSWFYLDPKQIHSIPYSVGKISIGADPNHVLDPKGNLICVPGTRPIILVGTFNKILQYSKDIFAFLYHQFYQDLLNTDYLVITGYSFGDKAINEQVLEWIYSDDSRKLLIIHHGSNNLKNKARYSLSRNWGDLIARKKLFLIPKTIENTSWNDIRKGLSI